MDSDTATVPELRNAGSVPAMPRKLFISLPVADLQRSIRFFEALGFTFDPQFTGAHGSCMLVGADAYCMLVTRAFFEQQAERPLPPPPDAPMFALAFTVESRAAVDTLVDRALALGASPSGKTDDHGFMYQRGFRDLDGYHWDPFWTDPAAQGG
ncbi:MAG: VOC family protein [Gemmatimonadaceae bacterium]|nr:VOC family protein [Gemmatimonadaceae bacterium]